MLSHQMGCREFKEALGALSPDGFVGETPLIF